MPESIIKIKNIFKHFPGVIALNDVSFDIYKNCINCIVGENGAGKSTLIKILTGALQKSSGSIIFNGENYSSNNVRYSMDLGISTIFQELNTINQLTVEQNLVLGNENRKFGIIRKNKNLKEIEQVLKSIEPSIDLKQKVSELSIAKKQIVEIVKAITTNAKVLLMDEVTASLSEEEVRKLFETIKELKKRNITIVYITHKLEEIFEIGDYVTVLRDGKVVGTKEIDRNLKKQVIIKMMTGRMVAESYIPSKIDHSKKVLSLKNIYTDKLKNINFDLYKNEILGFYGLIGSGKTEIVRIIYGIEKPSKGSVKINNKEIKAVIPKDVISRGIALVPEERREEGLLPVLSIRKNISLMNLKKVTKAKIINQKKETSIVKEYIKKLKIVSTGTEQRVSNLSGGNQQKVIISKCLNADSQILLMDEPTKGIDVGAKKEIHNIVRDLSKQRTSIIIFSSELEEIVNLCDRIILLFGGEIKKVLTNNAIDNEEIMHIVTGGKH